MSRKNGDASLAEHELAILQLWHWRDLRTIMITDPPGMGKTSLAMAAAHTLQGLGVGNGHVW